ncbi:MAG: ParA family protein [Bacteroidia bacterium]
MAKRIVFFNNKGGVGKTTMVYHTAYMLAELGYKVVVADFDPQTNLTAMFLSQKRLEEIFLQDNTDEFYNGVTTIVDMMRPVIEGEGIPIVQTEPIIRSLFGENIHLLVGNLALSMYEDNLSSAWTGCLNRDTYSFKVTNLFHYILTTAEAQTQADFTLIDIGPNLGAINRNVLIASDYVVLPVGSDLFSLRGIENLGRTLQKWRAGWAKRIKEWEEGKKEKPTSIKLELPQKQMKPIGYVALQHTAQESRPVKAYLKWSDRIPKTYKTFVLEQSSNEIMEVEQDSNCLGLLKHYHSLMPMAMEARKPIFALKPADGAIGAHSQSVRKVYDDFKKVTLRILDACK